MTTGRKEMLGEPKEVEKIDVEKLLSDVKRTKEDIVRVAVQVVNHKNVLSLLEVYVQNYEHALEELNNNTDRIHYWCDQEWCRHKDIEKQTRMGPGWARSSDHKTFYVGNDLTDDDIEDIVRVRVREDAIAWTHW